MEPIERIEITQENGKKNSSRYRILSTILWCVLAFAFGVTIAFRLSGVTVKELELKTMINSLYDGEINRSVYQDHKLAGMVSGLKDKNSFYIPKSEMSSLNEAVTGKFGGVGIQIATESDEIVVYAVTKGAPADRGGVKAGDIIVSVDGKSAEEITFNNITDYVRGEVGTEIVLGIKRNGKIFDVTLVREEIMVESVIGEIIEGNIGYLKISSFDEDTDKELEKALEDFNGKADSIIVDLRDNPGGFLYVCANTADLFLEKGLTIVKACYKNNENVMKTMTEAKCALPMAVLINGQSASSSEIFSSCMKDNKRATIIGEKSYGKGSIQRTHEFTDGSGVNLTVGHFYSPNGTKIDGVGVIPDIEVKISGETDVQLEKAIEVLK